MKEIDANTPILVTGGSGYIASWIIKLLLEKGHTVKASVRDTSKSEKINHLLKIGEKYPGKLELFEADLLKRGSFEEAMADCELVIHTASPFKIAGISDPQQQLVEPALEGTRNVLSSANATPSVKRVVLTSSVVAIYGDAVDIQDASNGAFTEQDWNMTSSVSHQPYPYSKTVAEREAWKIAREQRRWDLVTINPGFVLGPSLTTRVDSTSIDFMISMLNGKFKHGIPELYFGVVDVRDVAKAHILAGTNLQASGRHILVADTLKMLDLARILKGSNGQYPLPKSEVPKFLLYLFGPFQGFSWKFISRNVGVPMQFDNSYSKQDLGIEYNSIENTLHDHVQQIIESGLVEKHEQP